MFLTHEQHITSYHDTNICDCYFRGEGDTLLFKEDAFSSIIPSTTSYPVQVAPSLAALVTLTDFTPKHQSLCSTLLQVSSVMYM